jgi:hypothetical protein
MKTPLFIFVAVMATVSSFAADIVLQDGRVLKEAVVQSQAPRTVTIKHADGLSSVAKTLLPPELLAQYPLDEMAGQEADKRAAAGREAALAYQKAEAERIARLKAEREKSAAAKELNQVNEAAQLKAELASVKAKAKPLAEQYFVNKYLRNPLESSTCAVTIADVRRTEGSPNRWFVTGRAVITRYPSPQTITTQGNGTKEGQRIDTIDERPHSETRNFEGYYSTEGKEPTLDVTLR